MSDALAKANRMNLLYDFYAPLLTEKQQKYLRYYFQENYSLAEIAEQFQITRQAVYEHIRRSEAAFEEYEKSLKLLENFEQKTEIIERLEHFAQTLNEQQARELNLIIEDMTQS